MGGSNPNEIAANTRSMRDAVDHAVERLASANSNSINDVVHDIDRQILQNQYKTVVDPLFGDSATHQNTYSKAFTSLLNQKLEEQGLLPQVLMTFGENNQNYMSLSSGDKLIHNDTLALTVADFDGSQSYVEAQLARDMQAHKGELEHAKAEFAVGAFRIGGKEGISRGRFEAYAKEGNDLVGAKAMLLQFDTPDGFNRLSQYKPGGYIDRSDIQSMLLKNANSLTPDQLKGLAYMNQNYDKIAVKGVDQWDPGKRGITHQAMEEFAAKHHITWDGIARDQERQRCEQQVLDASLAEVEKKGKENNDHNDGARRNRWQDDSHEAAAKPKSIVTDGMGRDWQFKNLDANGNPQLIVEPDGTWQHVKDDQWRNGNKTWFGTIKAHGSDWVKTGRDGRVYTIHADGSLQNDYRGVRSEMDAQGRVRRSFINGPEIKHPVNASMEFEVSSGVTKKTKMHFDAQAAGANHDPEVGDYATVKSHAGNAVTAMAGCKIIYVKSPGKDGEQNGDGIDKLSELDKAAIKKQLALTPDNQGAVVMKAYDAKHHAVRYVVLSGLAQVNVRAGDEPEAGSTIAQVGNDGTYRLSLHRFRPGGPTVPIESHVTKPPQDSSPFMQYRVRESSGWGSQSHQPKPGWSQSWSNQANAGNEVWGDYPG